MRGIFNPILGQKSLPKVRCAQSPAQHSPCHRHSCPSTMGVPRAWQGPGVPVPPRFHSYFTNQKQKVNGVGLTTYFPGALGDRLSPSRLTHTLFIQSFKYPIVSVFSTLIFSILMIWSPAFTLLALAPAWGFFFFFFFSFPPSSPSFYHLAEREGKGKRVSKRSHISPNPSVFAAGRGSCWGQRGAAPRAVLAARAPSRDMDRQTDRQRAAVPTPRPGTAQTASPAECGICLCNPFPSFPLRAGPALLAGFRLVVLLSSGMGRRANCKQHLGWVCTPISALTRCPR